LLQSRDVRTCASALLDAKLSDIKQFCGYKIIYTELPSASMRLSENKVLVSNQEHIVLKCNNSDGYQQINTSQIQFIVHIGCFCRLQVGSYIFENEELKCENNTHNLQPTAVYYMLNIPYLSTIFPDNWVSNVEPNFLFNESVTVEIPNLMINQKKVEDILIGDGGLSFDMENVINRTLQSETVFSSLSDYLFDQIVKSKGLTDNLNLFSWQTWLELFTVLILVIDIFWTAVIHFRLKAVYALLALTPHTSAYPVKLIYNLATEQAYIEEKSELDYLEILRSLKSYLPLEMSFLTLVIVFLLILAIGFLFKKGSKPNHNTFYGWKLVTVLKACGFWLADLSILQIFIV